MPSIGAICMLWHGSTWLERTVKKSRLANIDYNSGDGVDRYFMSVAVTVCNKMQFDFGAGFGSACRSHIKNILYYILTAS